METITRKKRGLVLLCALSLLFTILASTLDHQRLLPIAAPLCIFSLALAFKVSRDQRMARLIMENKLLHIRYASLATKNLDAYISYFGILLDTKIIRFNQNRVFLRGIEIGQGFISLAYGTNRWANTARLLCAPLEDRELDQLVKAFVNETGLTPKLFKSGAPSSRQLAERR